MADVSCDLCGVGVAASDPFANLLGAPKAHDAWRLSHGEWGRGRDE